MTAPAVPGYRDLTYAVDPAAVDAPSAVEFMREALIRIDEEEVSRIAAEMERKRAILAPLLAREALARSTADAVRPILARSFATRRRGDELLVAAGGPNIARAILDLVHRDAPIAERFLAFDDALAAVDAPVRRELGSECLHFADPERAWLWSRWMWDPVAKTGALPLVMIEDFDFSAADSGGTYLRVGAAVSAVLATADELGFRKMRSSPFVVDVYLAAIYAVYLYTVLRIRMTQEFTRIVPPHGELIRRLLGVHRLDG
jgi:hypothetical protein